MQKPNLKLKAFTLVLVSLFTLNYALFTRNALAHCPLCTAGAGAGLALSRYLGVDDSITGIWLAALLGASSLWAANAIKKKYVPYQAQLIYWFILGSTIWSFYAFKLVNEHAGLIVGVPKLIFGMITGGILFFLVDRLNALIKKKRGKVLFAYQPIVFSMGATLILSALDFIFINYYI